VPAENSVLLVSVETIPSSDRRPSRRKCAAADRDRAVVPANELADEVRYRASQAGSAAIEILNAGASLSSRRQAMLYVTNGYDLDPPEVRVAEFASAAQRANVPVFAMNARGLRVRRHSLSRVTQPYGRAIAPLC
jgi:hypothetical protein